MTDSPKTVRDMIYDDDSWCTARSLREVFGFSSFWDRIEVFDDHEWPYPSLIFHEEDAVRFNHDGGTNLLAVGEKGSGKSTLALWLAARLMQANDEAVIWRGAQSRSEWLPYAPWTTLFLPANADVDARWQHTSIRKRGAGEAADLENIVNKVRYYRDPSEIIEGLEEHSFNVVYPDPTFTGCNTIMDESSRVETHIQYVSRSDAQGDENQRRTPTIHWWVALMVQRIEQGPYFWTTLLFDEASNLVPENAPNDYHLHDKVMAVKNVLDDSRKFLFSPFFFAHHETDIHSKVRRRMQWRISMPGRANPTVGDPPLGFGDVKMEDDMMSKSTVGHGLCYTEQNFSRFTWDDVSTSAELLDLPDEKRFLKISLSDSCQPDNHSRAGVIESDIEPQGGGSEVADD